MTAETFQTVPALLRHNAETYAGKPVLLTADEALGHDALEADSRRLAARLIGAGITRSSRVGVMMPNGIGWVVLAAAVMRVGAVLVPLSTLLKPPELVAHLRAADVTHLVAVPEFRGRSYLSELDGELPGLLETAGAGRRHPELPALRAAWLVDALPDRPVDEALVGALEGTVRPADRLAILFTSGSSGTPKGVVHTHGNALRAVAAGLDSRRIGPEDRLYIPMPFFWTGGFASGLCTVLVAGATLLTDDGRDPGRTLDLLERGRATLFRGWPDQAARIAAHPRFAAADLAALGDGSLPAVLPPDRRPAPGARANLFGMTETFGPYSGALMDRDLPEGKRGSCGRPFTGVQVRIVEPGTARECPPGTVGEIRLRGPNVMAGIWGRLREATFDRDGFYPTGDLGARDADGYLWYHGRLDDMFKVSGATVYPSEVEAALRRISGVRQAFVTAVPETDQGQGAHAVGALVVTGLDLPELQAEARSTLSAFKVPRHWVVLDDAEQVPLLASGKIDKAALRRLLGEAAGGRKGR